jgi:hypothetical protein
MTARRTRQLSFLMSFVLAAAWATTSLGSAAATPGTTFSADVLPTCVPANASVTFTATIRNDAATLHLGSANITAPIGFAITGIVTGPAVGTASVGANVVRLRDLGLNPGGSATVAFQATTPTADDYSWHDPAKLGAGRIEAKPTGDFTGSEQFEFDAGASEVDAFVGTCVLNLSFSVPPADAEVGANITGDALDPAGAAVAVEILSGPGGPRVTTSTDPVSLGLLPPSGVVGAVLSPAVPTVDAVQGLAVFDADQGDGFSITPQGLGYRVQATSVPGIIAAISDPFDIVNDGVVCSGAGCSGQASGAGGSVEVAAPDAQPGDMITVALNVEDLTCPGYAPLAGTPIVTFTVSGDSVRFVTIRVPAALATRPRTQDRVCYGSELAFVDRDGVTTNVGVLPPCALKAPFVPPCQLLTRVDKRTGDHIISFMAPPGSTKGRT